MMKRTNNSGMKDQRHCSFCIKGIQAVDYKDSQGLRRYTSSYAKIVPRRRSGVCAKHQRMVSQAIQRARQMALMSYVAR